MKRLITFFALIIIGLTAILSIAAGPNDPPGQGPCSHGNTGKPCKEDPSDKGKDCLLHGNFGGVNEDHCAPTATATTKPANSPTSTATTIVPTNTATPVLTPIATNTPVATSTSTATSTLTATATATGTSTSTPTSTSTLPNVTPVTLNRIPTPQIVVVPQVVTVPQPQPIVPQTITPQQPAQPFSPPKSGDGGLR